MVSITTNFFLPRSPADGRTMACLVLITKTSVRMADELQTMANELQTRCNTKYSLQNGVCVKSESAVNGVCGSAHGTYYSSVPSTGHLCSAGTASSVSGS
ncbi:MAG: hypothetical protein LBG52_06210 [Candidatus Peribacteria bacterium]|nr:hypothetical protein [Candidatus Peribacteria bacterium]